MAELMLLHLLNRAGGLGREYLVNLDHMVHAEATPDDKATKLVLAHGADVVVYEKLSDILGLRADK